MTEVVVGQLAEAMRIEAEVAPPSPIPALALPEEHPAPWSYQEELGGHSVPLHYQEELDAYTDDVRRRHVVRDARGGVVVQCVKFSKGQEEKLARLIASIPANMAEIERLSNGSAMENAKLRDRNAELEATVSKLRDQATQHVAAMDRLRDRIAELESTIAKLTEDNLWIPGWEAECNRLHTLVREMSQVLLASLGQTGSGCDARIAVAAKLLIELDISFQDLVLVLARAVLDATEGEAASCRAAGIQIGGGAA